MKRTGRKRIKILSLLICLTLLLGHFGHGAVVAQREVTIEYNGEQIRFDDNYGFPFIDENDRTQVPFRLTLETVGATVSWDQEAFVATAVKGGVRVDVPIGEKYILRNGEKILNDTTSRIINDRTYLPIRIVLEAFGATVRWDQANFRVIVEDDQENLFTLIPSRYDLREVNKTTTVKNQLDTGACWAFASFGAIESTLLPEERWDFSEDHLSLGHGFNLDQADGGNYSISLSYLTRWSGPVLEEEDVFNDGINNPDAVPVKHIQEAQFIPSKDYAGIKVALMTQGAVQSSIFIDDDSIKPEAGYYDGDTAAYYFYGAEEINHDVVIIGWDDDYPKENFRVRPSENGAFIIKNSYGEEFGAEGYFYISYEDVHIGTQNVVFTRIDEVDNYDKIYQTDWLGYIGQIGYGEDTAYFSNIYETESREVLKAVAFYATEANSTYEVYVVNRFLSTEDFSDMDLVTRGSFEVGGYYTIDLESPIVVDGAFAVVVKITTPGSMYPVAAEFYKDEPWLNNVDISDGIGFMSYDGMVWDRTETALEANICLKVFTDEYDAESFQQDIQALRSGGGPIM